MRTYDVHSAVRLVALCITLVAGAGFGPAANAQETSAAEQLLAPLGGGGTGGPSTKSLRPPEDVPGTSQTVAAATPQTAADAALAMANMFDGAGGGVSSSDLLSALQSAADAGQPIAMWRLGVMYENGEGVEKDQLRAFGYFARIANEHANTPPRSLEADIVAQSFIKMGDYYRVGLPDAGIKADSNRAEALMLHAATYFGDADAQYRVGELYLQEDGLGVNALQSARWLSLAARKGHVAAQARLGDLLFNGEGIEAQPVEGLMWLVVAHKHCIGTADEKWVTELLDQAMSVATADQRKQALQAADVVDSEIATR